MSEIQEKEMHLIDLDDDIQYMLKMFLEEDKIHFWLKEDKIFTPFTFEQFFTYEQFVEHHKIFKACDNLKEIHKHLINLYNAKRIKLMAVGGSNERMIIFNVAFISNQEEKTKDFTLELNMTENKDDDLLRLYKIQKDQIAALRKVLKLLNNEQLPKEMPFYKAIKEEIDKSESRADYE